MRSSSRCLAVADVADEPQPFNMSQVEPAPSGRRFRRLAMTTTALTYLLVSAGAIVRVTGAGMGCPDWPKCFGLLVPPTSVAELPPMGTYSYPAGWRVESFDPLMTWIEYLNRLLGALVGLFILATLVVAIVDFRRRRSVLLPTIGAFVGVLVAAWLGARVVAHELAPWMVTVHLGSAIVVVTCLVVAIVNASSQAVNVPTAGQRLAARSTVVLGVIALVQGGLGTQVRGQIEDIARHKPDLARADLLNTVGLLDLLHKNLAMVVVAGAVMVLFIFRAHVRSQTAALRAALATAMLGLAQFAVGAVLATLGLPKPFQVLHLLVAALFLGTLTAAGMLAKRT